MTMQNQVLWLPAMASKQAPNTSSSRMGMLLRRTGYGSMAMGMTGGKSEVILATKAAAKLRA